MGRLSNEADEAQAFIKARSMVDSGEALEDIVRVMTRAGVRADEATAYVQPLLDTRNEQYRKKGMVDLAIAGGLVAITAVIILLFNFAISNGGALTRGKPVFLLIGGGALGALYFFGRGIGRIFLGGAGESSA
ncbi:MAG: hypothetical protein P1V97_07350 [Planctomycetota bacterium]|nr:hypothetical protein [Planctomycetota bacterium]